MDTERKPITKFKGLNNVANPFRLTPDWAVQIDNVDITRTSGLKRCSGYTRRTTNVGVTGAYATVDQTRLYVVDSGELRQMNADLTYKVLKTGLSSLPVYFEEHNGVVYYSNGVDFGTLEPGGWRPWGVPVPDSTIQLSLTTGSLPNARYFVVSTYVDDRGMESGNSEVAQIEGAGQINVTGIPQKAGYTTNLYATMPNGTVLYLLKESVGTSFSYTLNSTLGRELPFWNVNVPRGLLPEACQGKMWITEWFPQYDYTIIWSSLPLHYHHFAYGEGGLTVPGEVRIMEVAGGDTLIIGTDRQVWSFNGDQLKEEAAYGVVDGYHPVLFDGTLFFWSLRGLCSTLPFKNLTEDKFYVAPGASAGAAVLEKDGTRRYVVALRQGGQPYNRR